MYNDVNIGHLYFIVVGNMLLPPVHKSVTSKVLINNNNNNKDYTNYTADHFHFAIILSYLKTFFFLFYLLSVFS